MFNMDKYLILNQLDGAVLLVHALYNSDRGERGLIADFIEVKVECI